ncbi:MULTISPECIES: ABC transporter ATP-binding protein [unclassified Brenneria]|uniref:ABC transporter ATP-binding protein n=1 Tax=unclassified Brenneria TaxID=2634434 RepID=UPI00155806F4|nr:MULTISPECIES: ABC transporter ATP-binding protein [unclassified Brenneria]MBJ7221536.1 ABC transporter ATP-binding protein [Brenneria sp. L3-3C-1]MEE3642778.1 ABC transporter ATP-binding protein [Brenneria sp. L3_3C_1]MEE3651040.1 ABC transporter ATP-binding protein [Brenneria sp. HEZEL_4_2_4]NPD00995.1 ABC transporter ATP-binding protein [Brenneria sp. hezel4-2-4]
MSGANLLLRSRQVKAGAELRLEGLTRRFGQTAAVDNLNLKVEPGEFVTLLGASGSGKTTTLMMVGGFTAPTAGRILIGGKNVTDLPPAKRDLGVVFQNYALFPHLSVFRNLAFPLEMRGVSGKVIRRKVADALDMVQLSDKSQRLPDELSGGQQQRIALARALIFEPQALLMDEPLGALDKKLREYMQLELKRLHTSCGATVLFVTHDQEEALTLSDRVAVMQDGRIAQIDTPQSLYERPENRWVAEFIGQSNFIGGYIDGVDAAGYDVRLDSGERVRGRGVRHLSGGQRVSAVLRPEKIRLAAAGRLAVNAVVSEVLYLGHTVKVTVRLNDGTALLVQTQNIDLERAITPGMTISLGWRPESLWFIAGEQGA